MDSTIWIPTKSVLHMHRAFLRLLKQKKYDSISIKEITEEAEVNRRTFYLHYENKQQLFEEILRNYVELTLRPFVDDMLGGQYLPKLHQLTEVVQNDWETASVLFSDTVPSVALSVVKDIFRQQREELCSDSSFFLCHFEDKLPQELYTDIICNNFLSVIRFIICHHDLSSDELVKHVTTTYRTVSEFYKLSP